MFEILYALTQFCFVKNLKLTFNWFPLAYGAHKFSLAKNEIVTGLWQVSFASTISL